MIIPFNDSEEFYHQAFAQTGHGMPKYRGSPMMGGSFWGRIIGFAKGLFSKAAPVISNLVTQAEPHARKFAGKAVDAAIDTAVTKVQSALTEKKKQTGGRKRIAKPRLKKTIIKKKK